MRRSKFLQAPGILSACNQIERAVLLDMDACGQITGRMRVNVRVQHGFVFRKRRQQTSVGSR